MGELCCGSGLMSCGEEWVAAPGSLWWGPLAGEMTWCHTGSSPNQLISPPTGAREAPSMESLQKLLRHPTDSISRKASQKRRRTRKNPVSAVGVKGWAVLFSRKQGVSFWDPQYHYYVRFSKVTWSKLICALLGALHLKKKKILELSIHCSRIAEVSNSHLLHCLCMAFLLTDWGRNWPNQFPPETH